MNFTLSWENTLKAVFLILKTKGFSFVLVAWKSRRVGRHNLVVVVTCDICKLQCMTDGSYVEF